MAVRGSFAWFDRAQVILERHREIAGETRFPEDAVGSSEWKKLFEAVQRNRREEALANLERLRSMQPSAPTRRLFISHRQIDVLPARRIAAIADRCGYAYWLDVDDPVLPGIAGGSANPLRAVLVAAVIEMALLNSSHVIAALTRNSFQVNAGGEAVQKGASLWIPYEYGRVKSRTLISDQAAAWISSEIKANLPEYLHLGRILRNEAQIEQWLNSTAANLPSRLVEFGARDPVVSCTTPLP